jgi:hypothetical protein
MSRGHLIGIIVGKLSWKLAEVPWSFLLEKRFKVSPYIKLSKMKENAAKKEH